MTDILKEFSRFLWRRDSDAALCLIIAVSSWLSEKDCREAAGYLVSLADYLKRNERS